MPQKKSKKKNPSNARYLVEQRWIKNKAKKLARHKKKHPNDVNNTAPINYKRVKPLSYWEIFQLKWEETKKKRKKA